MPTNWKQLKAIEAKNKKRILEICPSANDESGIYVFLRYEGEFKYAYIGQAKHLLTRLAQHLNGYQHIDLSIKRHGLYSKENPTGWQVVCANYPEDALDDTERQLIATYANRGYQLRNKTAGGEFVNIQAIFEGAETHDRETGINAKYLAQAMQALSKVDAGRNHIATIEGKSDILKPVLFKAKNSDYENTQLILPVRLVGGGNK